MSYKAIDLSTIAAPTVVETIDYATILAAMVSDLQSRDSAFDAMVESDPAYKILEVCAYREMLVRQRCNDACKAVMLAYATGTDLEQLGGLFGVTRKTDETDSDLRSRIQLSLEGLSTAGPEGAYLYHALSVDGVTDASIVGPPTIDPGNVLVTVMGSSASGAVTSDVVDAVASALNADDVRPLTDKVTVQSVTPTAFSIIATIYIFDGPDSSVVMAAAKTSVDSFITAHKKIGYDIPLSGIYAALHVDGVQSIVLASPAADLSIDYAHVGYCTGIELIYGGSKE